VGTTVGQHHFTDLTYVDDAAIFMSDVTQATSTLQSLNTIAASLGLRISWAKTKLQNMGAGNPPTKLFLDGAPVEGVEFIYLGSKQSSSGYCRPDMLRRVGLASSVMSSLQRIWKCSYLSMSTKVHLYQALVMSVLQYGAETWTLLAADIGTLEAFHMKCQRQMLNIHWGDHITDVEVLQKTGLSTISEILRNRRLSLVGHVARLDPEVPANKALLLMVNSHEGRKPSTSWTRPPSRHRRTWLNLVKEDAIAIPLSSLGRTEIFRGHGAAQRYVRTTRR